VAEDFERNVRQEEHLRARVTCAGTIRRRKATPVNFIAGDVRGSTRIEPGKARGGIVSADKERIREIRLNPRQRS
jgi:hypothetical protein